MTPAASAAAPAIADTAIIDPHTGGGLSSKDGRVGLEFPAGAASERLSVSYKPLSRGILPQRTDVHRFELTAHASERDAAVERFSKSIEISVRYTPESVFGLREDALALYWQDQATGGWVLMPSRVDTAAKVVTANVDHFSVFSLQGDPNIAGPGIVYAFQNDLHSGAATAEYPIEVPPGPGGFQPTLNLTYSSAGADEMKNELALGSWLGIGWNLSLGSIKEVYEAKRYLTINGVSYQMLQDGSGTWHTKYESYYRIGYETDPANENTVRKWWVWDKDGIYYEFGGDNDYGAGPTNDSRQYAWDGRWDGSRFQRPYRWDLNKIVDTNNNKIIIQYERDMRTDCNSYPCLEYPRSAYPVEIYYGAASSNPALGRINIHFVLGSDEVHPTTGPVRSDNPVDKPDRPAPMIMETRRLLSLEVKVDDTTSREYVFDYQTDPRQDKGDRFVSGKMYLTSITQKGADETPLPPLTMMYQNRNVQFVDWSFNGHNIIKQFDWPYLTSINNGYDGSVTFTYRRSPSEADSGGYHLPGPYWARHIVTQRTVNAGIGDPTEATTYTYAGGPSYAIPYPPYALDGNFETAQYRGYNKVTVSDGPGNTTDYYYYTTNGKSDVYTDCGTNRVCAFFPMGTYGTAELFTGRNYRIDYKDSSGATLRTVQNTYSQINVWHDSDPIFQEYPVWRQINFVYVSRTDDTQGGKRSTTTYAYNAAKQGGTQYGNLTDVYEWGEADPAAGLWYRHTALGYRPRTSGAYIVGKPSYMDLMRNNGANGDVYVQSTQYCYDGASIADCWNTQPGTRGLLTLVRRDLLEGGNPGNRFADEGYGYDSYGNRTSVTQYADYGTYSALGGSPRTTTIDYDSTYRAFPEITTNPLGHVETRAYDPRTGQVTRLVDANEAVWDYEYDEFGRLTKVWAPGEDKASHQPTVQHQYDTSTAPYQIVSQRRRDAGGANPAEYLTTRRFYDGLGRLLQEYADVEGGQSLANTHYDNRGLVAWQSAPRPVQGSDLFMQAEWQDAGKPRAQYTYDALGRPLTAANPDNTVKRTTYSNWTWRTVDENGHVKLYENDAFGRLAKVTEYTGTDPSVTQYAQTTYAYDVANGLVSVVDNAGNTTSITYDALGRKLAMSDPDMGQWSYQGTNLSGQSVSYDPQGHLLVQVDAKGNKLLFSYDPLGRLVDKKAGDGTTLAAYGYDDLSDGSFGKGRRSSMADPSGSTRWYYDARGRLTKEEKTIDGITYTTQHAYNALDQALTTTYPDLEVVSNTYDTGARVKTVTGGGYPYLANATYNAQGQLKKLELDSAPNRITTDFGYYGYNASSAGWGDAYDAPSAWGLAEYGRLWMIATTAGGQTLQNLQHGYDGVGNVTAALDFSPNCQGGWMNFGYDHLDRLTSAYPDTGCPNGYSESYTYDAIGNLTEKASTAMVYDSAHPHAVSATRPVDNGSGNTLFEDGFSSTTNWVPQSGEWWIDGSGRYANSSFALDDFAAAGSWAPQGSAIWELESGEYSNRSLLTDDFASGVANWQPSSGTWSWENGVYKGVSPTASWDFSHHQNIGSTSNYAIFEADVKQVGSNSGAMSLVFNWQDSNNLYMAELYNNAFYICKRQNGTWSTLASTPYAWSGDTWYRLKVLVTGDTIAAYINGVQYLSVSDGTLGGGKVGLGVWRGTHHFDNVTVRDWQFALNGKHLPGAYATYAVDVRRLDAGGSVGMIFWLAGH